MNKTINFASLIVAVCLYIILQHTDIVFAMFYAFGAFVVIQLFFLPTRIAYYRNNVNKKAIFYLNAFGGSTGLLWIAAIVWAVYEK